MIESQDPPNTAYGQSELTALVMRLTAAAENFPIIDENPKDLIKDSLEMIERLRDLFLEGFNSGGDHDLDEWESRVKVIIGA